MAICGVLLGGRCDVWNVLPRALECYLLEGAGSEQRLMFHDSRALHELRCLWRASIRGSGNDNLRAHRVRDVAFDARQRRCARPSTLMRDEHTDA